MHTVILITVSNKDEARKITRGLLQAKLAACVNIVNGVESHYWWEGKISMGKELLLMVKTRKSLVAKLIKKVRALHSYTVPEIIALPIIAGNKAYLEWIDESTR
jgi:periplasmic divalent cation tolerance protein